MDQLRALRYFSKVVETGSFTRAAEAFSVPPSSLSRRIADLEKSLGANLLKRSTRVVQVTEIGQVYYRQVQGILFQLEQSDETVRSYQANPTGQLRISSLAGFGERLLLPLLNEFKVLYPDIILDVNLSDELSTLGSDDVDVAIRGGYAPNEWVQAVRLMNNEFIPVAAPEYLKKMGTPKNAFELRQHKGLYFRTPAGPNPWLCEIEGEWHDVSAPAVAVSNSSKWLGEQAVAGLGIMMAPRWSLADYLDSGELEQLFFDPALSVSQNPDMAIYLLYQKQRYLVPKVKAVVDFLVARIKNV
ncbi:LysR family transcriptional regulator [Halieaceae bacterium IMCC14734]|uniref:LysR family transcriptional regulator n=1 Tax=Candidatus Litorirhabdus singularis TaxID=2518993 RepID=A0ABT3TFT4_9GAMM|nr:LysR family transcriptional regulator [Candidatus Litorirhabdus singularis]MCX2981138.1 LysR family transcriptional regulator [Candidatus Litorirhabdus singularis]